MPPRGNNTERVAMWLVKGAPNHAATVPPSTGSKRHASRSQKAQIVVLPSCQHHLYTADLHQMVLHRPVECTVVIVSCRFPLWQRTADQCLSVLGVP